MTLISNNEGYPAGALALSAALEVLGSTLRRIALVTPAVLPSTRELLHTWRLHGGRASVHRARDGRLPLTDHLANVLADPTARLAPAELLRVAAPGRSVVLRGEERTHPAPLEGAGSWTHQFANLSNTANGGDARTTSELRLLVTAPADNNPEKSIPVRFHVTDIGLGEVTSATDNFVSP